YKSISGEEYALFQRKKGCQYYDQCQAYKNADVLIFNSQKYLLETIIGRKPYTDLDIIDECDEFLDNFANEKRLNLNRLHSSLSSLFPANREDKNAIKEMIKKINDILYGDRTNEIKKLNTSTLIELFNLILKNPYIAEDEDRSYYNTAFEIAKSFEPLFDESYIRYTSQEQKGLFGSAKEDLQVDIVSINLSRSLQEIIDANNILILMSGTLHSQQVLQDIFGLKHFKIIDAETTNPGTISKYRTGLEKNCKYANFKSGNVTRQDYLQAFSACLKNAEKPTLVHVNAFQDLPSKEEKIALNLDIITREELREKQQNNTYINKFKQGDIDLLFTTKCSRGVDFPGDKCKSVILTKYPYPNVKGLFWEILKKEQPEKFMEFYLDKARRELLQKIYRAVRSKDDHVFLLSPDVRVLNANLK
ncbi:MAG: helicase C-terminal domain-containing protein, partial [Candidatus Nanoarchaeia archaeon]